MATFDLIPPNRLQTRTRLGLQRIIEAAFAWRAEQDRQETIVQEPPPSSDRELPELEFSRADFPAANGTYCRWMAHRL
jgi:hypothetical protein